MGSEMCIRDSNKAGIRSGLSSLDFRPVLRNPSAMGWIACYSTHNYELFAFRSWIVAYLAFALSGLDSGNIQPSLIVFVGVLLSMPASVIGNELSMRFGRTRIVNSIMGLSAVFAFLVGNSVGTTAPLLITIVLVYGCFVTGESASITTASKVSVSLENKSFGEVIFAEEPNAWLKSLESRGANTVQVARCSRVLRPA